MSYNSFTFFIIYFGITFLLYIILPKKYKWVSLLAGSVFFYVAASRGNVLCLVIATLSVWASARFIEKLDVSFSQKKKGLEKEERKALKKRINRQKKTVLILGLVFSLGTFIFVKYTNFVISTFNSIFSADAHLLRLLHPLGISFFSMQAISYLADVYYGKTEAERNPLKVLLYLSFMLTVVEGPIARYGDIAPSLFSERSFEPHDLVFGAQRIAYGLFKKVVVADRCAMVTNPVFDNISGYNGTVCLGAVVFYTVQLYFEFSGIIDVVSGIGEIFGVSLPLNFRQPFFSNSISEFWQRWHITLGSWLRDYIFYPISLSRPFMKLSKSVRSKFKAYYAGLIPTAFALFFVWFSNGLWHGASWKYVVYGLYYYIVMMIGLFAEPLFAKISSKLRINRNSTGFSVFKKFRTGIAVLFGMLIFRANDLTEAAAVIRSIFTDFSFSYLRAPRNYGFGLDFYDYFIILIGVCLVFAVSLCYEKKIDLRRKISGLAYPVKFAIFMLAALVIVIFGAYGEGYGVVDLIYAGF